MEEVTQVTNIPELKNGKKEFFKRNLVWIIIVLIPIIFSILLYSYGFVQYKLAEDDSVPYLHSPENCIPDYYCGEEFVWIISDRFDTYFVGCNNIEKVEPSVAGGRTNFSKYREEFRIKYEEQLEKYQILEKKDISFDEICSLSENSGDCQECVKLVTNIENASNKKRTLNRGGLYLFFLGFLLVPFVISLSFLIKGIKNKRFLSWIHNLDFLIVYFMVMLMFFNEALTDFKWGQDLIRVSRDSFLNNIGEFIGFIGLFALFTWPILFIFNFTHKAKTGIINKKWFWPAIIFGVLLELGIMGYIVVMIGSSFN